jgi:hypothetical protein
VVVIGQHRRVWQCSKIFKHFIPSLLFNTIISQYIDTRQEGWAVGVNFLSLLLPRADTEQRGNERP